MRTSYDLSMTGRPRLRSRAPGVLGALAGIALLGASTACASAAERAPQAEVTEAPMAPIESEVVGQWAGGDPGEPTLEFADDGTLSGNDGCNGIVGDYFADGGTVRVQLGASTLKACPAVDDWLRNVDFVTVDGDTMQVMNADGDEIGQLQRSDAAAE